MKVRLDEDDDLRVLRHDGETWRDQYCPFKPNSRCGDHCPLLIIEAKHISLTCSPHMIAYERCCETAEGEPKDGGPG